MIDLEFRIELQKVQDANPTNDAMVIQYVLDHAWDQYPRPFFIWLNRKIAEYDQFPERSPKLEEAVNTLIECRSD